jgi:hypothetical protein
MPAFMLLHHTSGCREHGRRSLLVRPIHSHVMDPLIPSQSQHLQNIPSGWSTYRPTPRVARPLSKLLFCAKTSSTQRPRGSSQWRVTQCKLLSWPVRIYFICQTPCIESISDGLSGITESHPELNPPPDLLSTRNHSHLEISDRPAHQAVLALLREHAARSVTYIILGPLTNLAQMLRADGACVRERIGRVVIMGGAIDVPGNVTPSAECVSLPFSHQLMDLADFALATPSQFLCRPIRS